MALWSNDTLQQYEKYLDLLPMICKSKRKAFAEIKDRVLRKLQTWKEKRLFQRGKEILLKAVALSILTYAMSCFKFSDMLCSKLESIISTRFWWRQKDKERIIYWVSSSKLCEPKCYGGMGLKNLKIFNQALLTKQG